MSQSLLVSVSPGELWAALCEAGEPVELTVLRANAPPRPGDIVLGRVVALKPELGAALVEAGLDRPAFLSIEDAPGKTLAGLVEGAALVVQVTKEARGGKAMNVTARPRLDGALLSLVPGGATELAAKGLDAGTLRRIAADVATLALPGEGYRLRAGAAKLGGAAASDLADDIARLRARWQAIETAGRAHALPARLEPEAPLIVTLLQSFARLPERIAVDDRAAFAEARHELLRCGDDAARLGLHAARAPLFEHEGVAAQIEAAQGPRVPLPGGASLAIERTEAAILIDVDSGGAPAMATNLAAAAAVARQIRLRNLAGAIIVDFIGVKDRAQRARIAASLARAAEGDPARPELLGWTKGGHFELVRRRRARALDEILCERAPAPRKTALTVALEALRALARAAEPMRAPRLRVAPEVAAALGDGPAKAARAALEARLGRAIAVTAEPQRARESFDAAPQ